MSFDGRKIILDPSESTPDSFLSRLPVCEQVLHRHGQTSPSLCQGNRCRRAVLLRVHGGSSSCLAPWLNLTSCWMIVHTTQLQQRNATLGKLTLLLDDLSYTPLLYPRAITFSSSPSRRPQHSGAVSPDALMPQEEFVFSLSRQSWRLDINIFFRETDFVCCFPVLSVGHCCARCQGWGSKHGPAFPRAVCSELYSRPEYLQQQSKQRSLLLFSNPCLLEALLDLNI